MVIGIWILWILHIKPVIRWVSGFYSSSDKKTIKQQFLRYKVFKCVIYRQDAHMFEKALQACERFLGEMALQAVTVCLYGSIVLALISYNSSYDNCLMSCICRYSQIGFQPSFGVTDRSGLRGLQRAFLSPFYIWKFRFSRLSSYIWMVAVPRRTVYI